jgi:uncharacterized membrane protein
MVYDVFQAIGGGPRSWIIMTVPHRASPSPERLSVLADGVFAVLIAVPVLELYSRAPIRGAAALPRVANYVVSYLLLSLCRSTP